MLSPNILVTNFCNQQCSYCFALKEFQTNRKKEMDIKDFEKLLLKMKKSDLKTVKLMGGEPILHSQFEKIVRLSFDYFDDVVIYTNGLFSPAKVDILGPFLPKIRFSFNLSTPAFISDSKKRKLILENINFLASKTAVALALTIERDTDIKKLLRPLPREILQRVDVRIGLANPIVGSKNKMKFKEFYSIGEKIYQLVEQIRASGSKKEISLNCGFTRCMFSDEKYEWLKKNKVKITGWGCFGKKGSFDITTNMEAFHCFPLAEEYRLKIGEGSDLKQLNSKILLKRIEYWQKFSLANCQTCIYYGHAIDKCPGPCIAFCVNSLRKKFLSLK